ncbi:MAG: hypothetical protein KKF98_12005 [Bacteroidetes bacterium]|nr:hypothetical protein [Bacteroidota bacterium]
MKKIIITSIILFSAILFNKLSAQNPIPSFNVPVIADPTVFEELIMSSAPCLTLTKNFTEAVKRPFNVDERTVYVKADKKSSKDIEWATYIVYSLDGITTIGPITILEGEVKKTTVDMRLWGVRVINASSDVKLSVWFE